MTLLRSEGTQGTLLYQPIISPRSLACRQPTQPPIYLTPVPASVPAYPPYTIPSNAGESGGTTPNSSQHISSASKTRTRYKYANVHSSGTYKSNWSSLSTISQIAEAPKENRRRNCLEDVWWGRSYKFTSTIICLGLSYLRLKGAVTWTTNNKTKELRAYKSLLRRVDGSDRVWCDIVSALRLTLRIKFGD
ncbi:hypothetical protein P691DRAFT_812565 [Macrolepiota fuliginosa MF-IS2]|uniref:Uncharacterized protein n=1 Tax=Macrolepiota fuliginosa MF-IS2 TaxID=1400762 RepID=A0A9P6BW67_9AGAR|nr:hypothetical protein P691DRAFT_812565 [Macrolepiota fuliginosa MF-IS2]